MKGVKSKLIILIFIFIGSGVTAQFTAIPNKYKTGSAQFNLDTLSYSRPSIMMMKYNVDQLPFFCKMEEMITRQARFNFRFRIGSLDYVNGLEYGKYRK